MCLTLLTTSGNPASVLTGLDASWITCELGSGFNNPNDKKSPPAQERVGYHLVLLRYLGFVLMIAGSMEMLSRNVDR